MVAIAVDRYFCICHPLRHVTLVRHRLQGSSFVFYVEIFHHGPNFTTSYCCRFIGKQVVQQAVSYLDMLECCGFTVSRGFAAVQLVVCIYCRHF